MRTKRNFRESPVLSTISYRENYNAASWMYRNIRPGSTIIIMGK